MKGKAPIAFVLSWNLLTGALFLACALAPVRGLAAGAAGTDTDPGKTYDNLIIRARAGEREPALAYLRARGEEASRAECFDHILIASWAGKPEEVLEVYARLPDAAEAAPAAVQQALARALRDVRRWDEALEVCRTGQLDYPEDQAVFAAGEVLTLVDAGWLDAAVKTGLFWVEQQPGNADLRLALAYAHTMQARPFEALFHADKARQLAPDVPWVMREYVLALQRAELFEPALMRAREHPELFTGVQMRALEADAAASQTRLAAMPARSETERFVIADRALARYARMLPEWQALGDAAAADVIRIRIDRLSALHARARMHDVMREYEALSAEGVELPLEALSQVASAYLDVREPETARDLYREVLARLEAATPPTQRADLGPANARLKQQIGLFYALSEAEQFPDIAPLLDDIRHYGPKWLYFKGSPVPMGNVPYLDAQRILAAGSLVLGDAPAAQAALEAMLDIAPNNGQLRMQLAGIYRARAQPRRAERQLKRVETMHPRDLGLEIEQGTLALELQEWRQAEQLRLQTLARAPEHQAAQRLARQWHQHNQTQLRIQAAHGLGSDNPAQGRNGLNLDTVVYSSPILYRLRLFAGALHAQARFQEGAGVYTWQRAGAEWRSRDFWAEAELSSRHDGHRPKTGVRLSAGIDVNDHWHLGADLETHARRTPLRALHSGISSDAAGAYLRWRAHERREWWLSTTGARFSDRNQRRELELDGRERIHTSARLELDAVLSLAAQHNSEDAQRPYYNPKRALMLLPGLRVKQLLQRRYDTAWEHSASVSAGTFWQRFYGTGRVLVLSYGQRYRHHDGWEAGLTISTSRRPYDGHHEREAQILLDLSMKF